MKESLSQSNEISARNKAAKSEEKVSIIKSIISSKMKKANENRRNNGISGISGSASKKAETHGGVMKMAWRHEAKAKIGLRRRKKEAAYQRKLGNGLGIGVMKA
jgi:hypothetical protein